MNYLCDIWNFNFHNYLILEKNIYWNEKRIEGLLITVSKLSSYHSLTLISIHLLISRLYSFSVSPNSIILVLLSFSILMLQLV